MAKTIWSQVRYTVPCPDTPRLDGKLALVTGGNGGIGLEVSRGLARRGAEVVIAARHEGRAQNACRDIAGETGRELGSLRLDLSDLASVKTATEELADRWHSIVVLKGAATVVTDADRVFVNKSGNPGMACGGAGDVLTGLITARLAQGMDPLDAAIQGVWLHGRAGAPGCSKQPHAKAISAASGSVLRRYSGI